MIAAEEILALSREAKFWARVQKSHGCWLWVGTRSRSGPGFTYGRLSWAGRQVYAHRLAYELLVGPIPDGLRLDHLCRNTLCVNPAHLEPVSPGENVLRGTSPNATNKRKTHCIHGHEFTPENTSVPSTRPTNRNCRACSREASLRRRATTSRQIMGAGS